MHSSRKAVIGLFSFLMMISLVQTSQAELWEFIVETEVEKNTVQSGDTVVVTGKVVDQAYKATRGVEILIRTGSETTKAFTSTDGTFRGEFPDFQRIPGTYVVNVIASWYGMTGLASTEFLVKGESTVGGALIEKLSSEEARKYLSSDKSDFEKDPIGQTLFKYYHGLHDKLVKEKEKANEASKEQILLDRQRAIAENLDEATNEGPETIRALSEIRSANAPDENSISSYEGGNPTDKRSPRVNRRKRKILIDQ